VDSPPPTRIPLPSASEPEVSIVVLLDGTATMAERCLRAVADAHDPAIRCETVLVLNRPSADLEALVRERTSGARTIVTRTNAGPAVGWNLGADLSRAPRLAILHEDSEPDTGWLPPLVATMADRGAGVVGSRLYYRDGRLQSCGWVLCADASPILLDERTAPELAAAREPTPADMVSGGAMLIDREVLRAAGGFDERFHPAVYTDIDLCEASWAQGRPVLSVPGSSVRHETGALDRRQDPVLTGPRLRLFLYERNRDRYLGKWGATVRGGAPPAAQVGTEAAVAAGLERLRHRAERPPSTAPVASRVFTDGLRLVEHEDGTYGLPPALEARLQAAEDQVIREYCTWLAVRDGHAEHALAELRGRLAGAEEELASARAAAATRATELERERDDLAGQLAAADDRAAAAAAELDALRQDAHTLQLILNGRWWRLRNVIRRVSRRR
jgi:GT2 family glycosyltransferase